MQTCMLCGGKRARSERERRNCTSAEEKVRVIKREEEGTEHARDALCRRVQFGGGQREYLQMFWGKGERGGDMCV